MSTKVYPLSEAADLLCVPKLLARTLILEHGVPVVASGKNRVVLPEASLEILRTLTEQHRQRQWTFGAVS